MARYIDVTNSGGDLVVLGNSLVVPVSNVDSLPNPLNGALRFNPTLSALQIYHDGLWYSLSGYLTTSASFLSLIDTPNSYAGFNNYSVKVNPAANAVEFIAPGQLLITITAATAITPALNQAGYQFRTTSATAVTVTIPTNASVAFPIGTTMSFNQGGAGAITFGGSGVTIDRLAGFLPTTVGLNSIVQLVKYATDSWTLYGGLATG